MLVHCQVIKISLIEGFSFYSLCIKYNTTGMVIEVEGKRSQRATIIKMRRSNNSINNNNSSIKSNYALIYRSKSVQHLPSGNTCRIFRYDVVSLMIDALSNCDVMALGNGSSFASSKNSAFSFSRRERAAFLLFSFMAQRADKPKNNIK